MHTTLQKDFGMQSTVKINNKTSGGMYKYSYVNVSFTSEKKKNPMKIIKKVHRYKIHAFTRDKLQN